MSPAALFPARLLLPPWLRPCDPLRNYVLETAKGPFHARDQYTRLRTEKQHCLHYHLEKHPGYPHVGLLLAQDPFQPRPTIPRPFQVYHHRRPVVIPRLGYHIKRYSIGLEVPLRNLPHLLFCQTSALSLRSLGALGDREVPPIQC